MGIKKSLLVFLLTLSVFTVTAQTTKCEEGFAAFETNVKAGVYDDALSQLKELVQKCPKHTDKLYIYGETALTYKIEAAGTTEERKEHVDNLISLYAQFDKNFPANTNNNDVKKALLLSNNKMAADDEVFKILDAAFKAKRQDFTDYNALELYYNLYLKQFEAGNKGITEKDFISKYGEISGQVAFARNKFSAQQKELLAKQQTQALTAEEKQTLDYSKTAVSVLEAVGENVEKQSSKYFSCDKLEAYYGEFYEKRKEDAAWLGAMVNTLMANKCRKSVLLQKGAVALYELKPDTETAFTAGTVAQGKNDLKEAIKYFDIAAGLEGNAENKAGLYMKIAGIFRNSDKAQAKAYALKAAQLDSKSGKPYMFLAEMYSSLINGECGLAEFERKALLWLAIETVKKAEIAEPKYKPTAEALIKNYQKNLPDKQEAKAAGKKKGDQITYGCWINETVTVPNI